MSLTIIRGGTVVNHDHSRQADVVIDGETIAAIGPKIDVPAGAKVIDASGAFILPGGIDPHTHLEMPFMGTTSTDDFSTGTRAALSGGTTMVVDFCLPAPGQSLLAAYQDWRAKGAVFLTPPKDHGRELRCYLRDPDGHLIEVGQTTGALPHR